MQGNVQANPAPLIFNPFSPEVTSNPYPFYDRFRTEDPVYKTPFGPWFLSRHSDVALVLRDKRFGRDFPTDMDRAYGPRALEEPILAAMSKMMLFMEPPDHTRTRGLVAKAFSARRVEDMRPEVQSIADQLIHAAKPNGRIDIIRDFATLLPMIIICNMLGIPQEDRGQFFEGARINGRMLDAIPMNREEMDAANAQVFHLESYFRELFELRRRKPGDDLTTVLVQAEEAGNTLSDQELISNIMLLFGAGYETTSNLIGNSVLALFRNPQELAKLRRDFSILQNGTDELLRYDAPVQFTGRTALEDVVLDGKHIQKGDFIFASLGSANRDPSIYENPDKLDLSRKEVRPLSFGGGIHFCLGAQLARIELEIGIASLLQQLPNLTLEFPEAPNWRSSFVWRGLQSLPAVW